MDQPEFGRQLQRWRHSRRLTQQELADALGYDVTYVAKLEGGRRPATAPLLARLAQVAGGPIESVPAPPVDAARPPLPSAPDALIGRDGQLADLLGELGSGARCLSLVGPPGIGKTRLALELAARAEARLHGDVWWVVLREVQSADQVPAQVRRVLGIPAGGETDPVDGLCAFLRNRPALLMLDNFEHVLGARHLVERLIAGAASVSVVTTSREPLRISHEQVRVVAPLTLPAGDRSLQAIGMSPAVELFVSRARMARSGFLLNDANAADVADACRRLDGIPLAIVLAAGAVRSTDAAHLAAGVGLRTARCSADGDVNGHLRTLDQAIAGSWDPLDVAERAMFAGLSVCATGCTATAAAAIAGVDDTLEAWDILDRLVRKSLVEARPDAPGGPRFDLLETTRAFARDRLAEGGDGAVDEAHLRQARFCVAVVEELGRALIGKDQLGSLAALVAEYPNLAASFEWAMTHRPRLALRLASSLWRFFLIHDIPAGRAWLQRSLDACSDASPDRAQALVGAGALAWVTGCFDDSAALLTEGLDLAEHHGRRDIAALAWLNRGALAEQLGQLTDAEAAFSRALEVCDPDDARSRATALIGQGVVWRRRGDIHRSCRLWLEASQLFHDAGDVFNQAMALSNLALAAEEGGHLDEAQELRGECRRIQVTVGDTRGLAITTSSLGRIAFRRDRLSESRECHLEALEAFRRLGDVRRAASALLHLAAIFCREGRHHRATRLVGAVDALREQLGAGADDDGSLRHDVIAGATPFLGDEGVVRALTAGRALALDVAADLAAAEG